MNSSPPTMPEPPCRSALSARHASCSAYRKTSDRFPFPPARRTFRHQTQQKPTAQEARSQDPADVAKREQRAKRFGDAAQGNAGAAQPG